jgi:hypothetical protein
MIGRAARRASRALEVEAALGEADTQAALDILELVEFAWHDCYREITPGDDVIDDIIVCSRGSLTRFASAARLAVEDFRDLRMAADAIRAVR